MMTIQYSTAVMINDSKVVTEESLKEYMNSPIVLFTLLRACATDEKKIEYDMLLKLTDNRYDKVIREIIKDFVNNK